MKFDKIKLDKEDYEFSLTESILINHLEYMHLIITNKINKDTLQLYPYLYISIRKYIKDNNEIPNNVQFIAELFDIANKGDKELLIATIKGALELGLLVKSECGTKILKGEGYNQQENIFKITPIRQYVLS